jgi:hypothetical protein
LSIPAGYAIAQSEGEEPLFEMESDDSAESIFRPVSLQGIYNAPLAEAQNNVRSIDSACRFDRQYSWFKEPQIFQEALLWSFQPEKLVESLQELFLLEDYLDTFISRCTNAVNSSNDQTPLMAALGLHLLRKGAFQKVLSLRRHLNSPLAISKLSFLTGQFLLFDGSNGVVETLLEEQDLENVYNLACLVNLLVECPPDIYPLHHSTLSLASQLVNDAEFDSIMQLLLISYYLSIIRKAICGLASFKSCHSWIQSQSEVS